MIAAILILYRRWLNMCSLFERPSVKYRPVVLLEVLLFHYTFHLKPMASTLESAVTAIQQNDYVTRMLVYLGASSH